LKHPSIVDKIDVDDTKLQLNNTAIQEEEEKVKEQFKPDQNSFDYI
jgi:hypothetical protein